MGSRIDPLIVNAVLDAGDEGISLDELEATVDRPRPLLRYRLLLLGDAGLVWWDEQSPRRVHAY